MDVEEIRNFVISIYDGTEEVWSSDNVLKCCKDLLAALAERDKVIANHRDRIIDLEEALKEEVDKGFECPEPADCPIVKRAEAAEFLLAEYNKPCHAMDEAGKIWQQRAEQAEARVKELEIKVRAYEEENPNIAYDCGKRIKELEGKIKPLKNALRSCMNELLKDCVSPELQDYFDYVKDLKSRLAAAESLHDLYVSETATQINDLKRYKEATQNKESERERQLAAAREGLERVQVLVDVCVDRFVREKRLKEVSATVTQTLERMGK